MPKILTLPALSPTMEMGTLQKWLVKQGDSIDEGDLIAEIETDKAVMEMEAIDPGTIGKILIPEGSEDIPVGQSIAVLLEKGEGEKDLESFLKTLDSAPTTIKSDSESEHSLKSDTPKNDSKEDTTAFKNNSIPSSSNSTQRVFISPLARVLAKQHRIDISTLKGTGPRGRIIKEDIEAWLQSPSSRKSGAEHSKIEGPATFTIQPYNAYQKALIKHIVHSKQNIPHFYVSKKARMDAFFQFRKDINESQYEKKVSINDMLIVALAKAIKNMPDINVAYDDKGVIHYNSVDVSVAVAVGEKLFTPIIFAADSRSIIDISKDMTLLIEKTKEAKLQPKDYTGGTVTISNMGMLGVDQFSAIINDPQSMILAISSTLAEPVALDGSIVIAQMMTLTISVDHRVINGAVAAKFLQSLVNIIEHPVSIIL